ncbi:MAG: YciI family protein [Thermoanaerobaculia bacterium]
MRVMILRKADKETEAGVMPSEELLTMMGKYMEDLEKAGVLLGGEGLQKSARGKRVKFVKGKPTILDGPFAETKELIAGYLLLQVKSLDDAVQWARRWPALDAKGALELEVRQIFEAEDFGPEFTPELREAEEKLRAKVDKKTKSRK